MAQQTINIGASPNDGTGTPLRTAFQYTNSNFSELYTAVGPSGNNIVVPGSATITGDLTVDTSTLKVDSANNRVGVVNASPSFALDVNGAGSGVSARISSGSGTGFRFDTTRNISGLNRNYLIGCDVLNEGWFSIVPSTALGGGTFTNPIYNASYDGIHAWSDGAGSERMRLNSTGLGVGVSPSYKLDASATTNLLRLTSANGNDCNIVLTQSGVGNWMLYNAATNGQLRFQSGGNDRMIVDTSGNVGIGVTPSAWLTGVKALDIGSSGLAAYSGGITHNAYFDNTDGRWEYKGTGAATFYNPQNGIHQWFVAASGIANNPITTFANAAMTLDASGNLLVGTTSNTNLSRVFSRGTATSSALALQGASGDVALAQLTVGKFDNDSTTSQIFVRFTINDNSGGSGQINANGASQAAFGTFSDSRLKENIVSLPSQLANILSLRPVEFDYKDGSGHQIGFVAQEMQEVYSDAVGEQNGFLTVTGWSKTEARLVSAIKELAAKVQALEAKLA